MQLGDALLRWVLKQATVTLCLPHAYEVIWRMTETAGSAEDTASAFLQEVTGTEQAAAGAGGELLNAFNVATFKNEEDDTAFWNRLIPSTERAAPEEEPQELGIRAARLKVYDEVGMNVYIRYMQRI